MWSDLCGSRPTPYTRQFIFLTLRGLAQYTAIRFSGLFRVKPIVFTDIQRAKNLAVKILFGSH